VEWAGDTRDAGRDSTGGGPASCAYDEKQEWSAGTVAAPTGGTPEGQRCVYHWTHEPSYVINAQN